MTVSFDKYQGTGNDFVMIDNRNDEYFFSKDDIIKLCRPHFGIGSDGLIILEKSQNTNFSMRFFNPDGSDGMMCGNGGRCVVAFAKKLGIIEDTCTFEAPDGIHYAKIINGDISLQMSNPHFITFHDDGIYMNTGTSHFVCFVEDLENIDVELEGRKLRHDKRFDKYFGCNVNFVKKIIGTAYWCELMKEVLRGKLLHVAQAYAPHALPLPCRKKSLTENIPYPSIQEGVI